MSSAQVIRTVIELGLVCFALWAVFHEDIFIAFEERLIASRKRKQLKLVKTVFRNTVD